MTEINELVLKALIDKGILDRCISCNELYIVKRKFSVYCSKKCNNTYSYARRTKS